MKKIIDDLSARVRDTWRDRGEWLRIHWGLSALVALAALASVSIGTCAVKGAIDAPPPPPTVVCAKGERDLKSDRTYTVKRRDFLRKIAEQEGVGWEALLLANECFLQEQYQRTCGRFNKRYRRSPHRRGTFCNDRYHRPYGNTLLPGWVLEIPSQTAPPQIERTVADVRGKEIALVIDDTGSMQDDRREVGGFYLAALKKYGKEVVWVYLYSDGHVRKYEADGNVAFLTEGAHENTHSGLKAAAEDGPDAIILVTDEPGDDWVWSDVDDLPPVYAHCLQDGGNYTCRDNLERLAKESGGRYVEGI